MSKPKQKHLKLEHVKFDAVPPTTALWTHSIVTTGISTLNGVDVIVMRYVVGETAGQFMMTAENARIVGNTLLELADKIGDYAK